MYHVLQGLCSKKLRTGCPGNEAHRKADPPMVCPDNHELGDLLHFLISYNQVLMLSIDSVILIGVWLSAENWILRYNKVSLVNFRHSKTLVNLPPDRHLGCFLYHSD